MKMALHGSANSEGAAQRRSLQWIVEAALLVILFLVIDGCVLKFVFPKYLDPFWPHHSDYYLPAAIAFSPAKFWDLFTYPRPVGQLFFWIIGHLKTRGAMVAVLCVVAANYALLVMAMRRAFQVKFHLGFILSATLFGFLLAVHPYQYQFSTWDAFAQLSLFLLMLAFFSATSAKPWWISATLVLLAFLAKETYIVSAGFLTFVWWLSNKGRPRYAAPMLIIGGAGVLAIVAEHLASSPFTSGVSAGGPYQIVLSVSSISHEWLRYAVEGMNWLSLCVVLLTAVTLGVLRGFASKELLWSVALPVAGALAWLPNSLLPYHHFEAYSFSGAYLIYLPVVCLALVVTLPLGAVCAFIVAGAAFASPVLSAQAFANQSWIVMNQMRQKMFLQTFGGLIKGLPGSGKIVLVSGISFPYSMFFYRYSVRSLNMPANTHFFVVEYENKPVESITKKLNGDHDSVVTFITPQQVDEHKFDEAWLFRDNGGLLAKVVYPSEASSWSEAGMTELDVLKYPLLADSFGPTHQKRPDGNGAPDGYAYLSCGVHMIDYNNLGIATQCLEKAASALRGNPYSSYWLGVALEKQGKIAQARAAYQDAIKAQSSSPNPAFQQALDRLH
ncbi:hypothetical protein [Paraburkholderia caribensis]|uniref:tetratricopeptide repeat protein n=1 Tax=Paraburkholderia caribensis TaxID=75105 RepID=UPI0031D8147F